MNDNRLYVPSTNGTGASARALVLGGGGSAGNAWEIGVVAGLFAAGLDVTRADLVVGTSAGATVAAQITSTTRPPELLAAILAAAPPPPAVPVAVDAGPGLSRPVVDLMERTGLIIAAAQDAADMRRRLGAAALELEAALPSPRSAQWRAVVAARLPSAQWPQQSVLITAVDARTGEPVVFDRHFGVDLVDAVAASTSSGPPFAIGENRYIDGGYRRNENADLAAGHARVLVLSPFGGRSRQPLAWGLQLAAQVEELTASGSRVEVVAPAANPDGRFGVHAMDPSMRAPAARTGYEQGTALAEELAVFWS